jgi:hypothetical protein
VIVYNLKAFLPLSVAAICAFGAHKTSGSEAFAVFAAGFGAIVFDLIVLRFMADKQECSPIWIHPEAGGHVYFIPIWIVGAIAIVASPIMWLGGF